MTYQQLNDSSPSRRPRPHTRREMLAQCANGFGALALSALWGDGTFAAPSTSLAAPGLHHPARAKSVIFLYMDGGPSQMDTFDPKPRLDREHGQPLKIKAPPTQFEANSHVLKSPWKFRQYGESGLPVSDLFPHVGECVDQLCVIRSMVAKFPEHSGANYFLHTGQGRQGHPSLGAWSVYGLGSETRELPGFVVLSGGQLPPGGVGCFANGYLPANFQASILSQADRAKELWLNSPPDSPARQRLLDLISQTDREFVERVTHHDALDAAIANHELACRMQTALPEALDISSESTVTQTLYGLDEKLPQTRVYARQCLQARRLVERGVRFVELLCPANDYDLWDQHQDLEHRHAMNALAVDKPIAGLLRDLEGRGLLNETLVVWAGEFGRAPMAQFDRGSLGRDHNQFGFSIWLAGGGVRAGMAYGATDEYGYFAIENKMDVHDLHATILHQLGIDHTRLTFRHGGRDIRLTDIYGRVIHDILS